MFLWISWKLAARSRFRFDSLAVLEVVHSVITRGTKRLISFFFFNPDTNWCLMPIFIPGGCQLWYSGFIISFVFCLINEDMLLIIYYLTTQWHSSFKERDGSFSTLSLIIGFQYNWLVPIIIKRWQILLFSFYYHELMDLYIFNGLQCTAIATVFLNSNHTTFCWWLAPESFWYAFSSLW